MQVSGNTILITGGTSGIGLAMAEKFLEWDNQVIICGRREERLRQIREKNPRIQTRVSDMADPLSRRALHQWVLEQFPGTNVLVNNAGIQLVTDLTQEVDLNRIGAETEINLIAPIHLSSLFAPHLAKKENAAIINISSGLAFVPLAFMPVYCATKAAMHSFSLSLRYQLRKTPVKVIEIIPPSVDTELGHDRRADKSQTHGGIPIAEFIEEAMAGLKTGETEIAVGQAKALREKGEEIFEAMNGRVHH